MFNDRFDRDFDEAREQFNKTVRFAKVWFAFVAILALSLLGGGVYVVYRVLLHFGIM